MGFEVSDYRHKPHAIRVVRFEPRTAEEAREIAAWCGHEFGWWVMEPMNRDKWFIGVPPYGCAHGSVNMGDLIVQFEDGTFRGVFKRQADTFLADYERVTASGQPLANWEADLLGEDA